ncbi:Endo-1,4-beta-xylanase Z precursor [Planctomycetes bacterium CA13]|uniref:Endo-1,4-beta-xylanase Z n=1 Tax=Novipirellula herctigrandis TaxID=2527986 RepID=A0A5C5Z9S3_9BACT|nr:Endo-1,4-beta-xylanase Z precursor [Planctomycetes bacterium CA13]
MSARLSVFFGVLCCLSVLHQSAAYSQEVKVRWNAPIEEWQCVVAEKIPGMVHGVVKSKSMNREVGYNIYLPPSYESKTERRFPVVYYLHGASGSEKSAYEGAVVRRPIQQKKLSDVISVFPNGGHFSKSRDWDNANVKAETFVIRELVPYVDANYRTIATREGRALTGFLMGGDASLRFVFNYPEIFCAAATVSAAIDWGASPGDQDTIFAHSKRNVENIRNRVGLMMVVAEDDGLFAAHQRLTPHLDDLEIEYDFRSYKDVGHNLGTMKEKCEEDIVLMLARHYSA